MSEFDLVNRLAPEKVESIREEFVADVVAPMAAETLADVNRELETPCCSVCAARVVTLAKIRAALDTCPCREGA